MLISLKSLAQSPEGKASFAYSIDLSEEKVNYDFPFQAPVKVAGTLTDKSGAVFFDAHIDCMLSVHCARCNKAFLVDKQQEVHFLLSTANPDEAEADDIYYLTTDVVDTDEIIVPEILMDMDMSYLCGEDCKGLCPTCGADLNNGSCACSKQDIDPRLLKLKELLKDEK